MTLFDGDDPGRSRCDHGVPIGEWCQECQRRRMDEARAQDERERQARAPRPNPREERARRRSIESGEAAQKRADDHADALWKKAADEAIEAVARMMEFFTTDDVWEYGNLRGTWENRALGPRMTAAAKRGICVNTRRTTQSRQLTRHGGPQYIWQSLIHEA